ncbi:MAG: hypothetical protein ACXWNG_03885, partial [Candidatus Limnocylindrales bacterium]
MPVLAAAPAVTVKPALAAPVVAKAEPPKAAKVAPAAAPKEAPAAPAKADAAPAVTPAAPDSPAPKAAAPGEEALERLRRGWPEFVERVSANPMLKPVVAACRPVEVRDGVVVLGFPEETPFYREKAEQRRAALEAGVEAV